MLFCYTEHMIYSEKLRKAVQFASHKHADQKREILNYPYITHPLMVMHLVSQYNNNDDVLCAAVLHDTIEDTETSLQEIKELFGARVARLVDLLTHDNALPYDEKYTRYFERMFDNPDHDVLLIKSADMFYNLTDMITSYQTAGKEAFLNMFSNYDAFLIRQAHINKKLEAVWPENPFLDGLKEYFTHVQQTINHEK